MFTIPVYIAILTGRRITDVLAVFETPAAAVAQCRQWIAKASLLQEDLVHPGYLYYAQYGTAEDTVRVEKHHVELQDGTDEEHEDDVPCPRNGKLGVLHRPEAFLTRREDSDGSQDAE